MQFLRTYATAAAAAAAVAAVFDHYVINKLYYMSNTYWKSGNYTCKRGPSEISSRCEYVARKHNVLSMHNA